MVEEKRRNRITPEAFSTPVTMIEAQLYTGDLLKEICIILQAHNCSLEKKGRSCFIAFPPGTTKIEIWPRIHNARFQIILPDKFILYEHEPINKNLPSSLYFPQEAFSQEFQKKYRAE